MNQSTLLFTFATLSVAITLGFEAVFQGSCEDRSLCDQVCIDLRDETHECSCLDSFALQPDGVSCLNLTASEWQQLLRAETNDLLTSNNYELTTETTTKRTTTPQAVKVIPYLNGKSYANFQSQTDLNRLSIQLEFKPSVTNTLLLYANELSSNESDYFAIVYLDETLAVWFTCENDNIRVRHEARLALNQWHQVSVIRTNCRWVEITTAWNTEELPKSQSDTDKIYNFNLYGTDKSLINGVTVGSYVGCIREFQLDSIDILTREYSQLKLPESCPSETCDRQTCRNGGKCVTSQSASKACLCPLGFTGRTCETEISIRTPEFSGLSWLKHLAPIDFRDYMELSFKLRPSGPEGIIFYCGSAPLEQYVIVYMVDSYLYLQFDLGTGSATIKSEQPLTLHRWHSIEAWRSGRGGLLKVDSAAWVEGLTDGGFSKMTPAEFLYVGGAPTEVLPGSLSGKITKGLQGCVENFNLNQRRLPLITAAISGANIAECGTSPCATHPCINKGNCTTQHDTYVCLCPFPYIGDQCQRKIAKTDIKFGFKGTSYLKFEQYEVMQHVLGHELDLEITFKQDKTGGSQEQILAFTGKETVAGDFLEMGITADGHIYVRYDLGDGMAEITHDSVQVNDGLWHKAVVKRSGRATTIYVDQHAPVTKIVAGDNNQLNVYQALYIGSKPGNIEGEIPQKGLRGCVAEIILGLNFRIDNINQVTQAVNIHDCSN